MITEAFEYRTGLGTDIHKLVPGRDLMLGGIHIPFALGLLGHSDGDVVLHAVIDAILGAAGMGDIGTLFNDRDPRWADFDSKDFLLIVMNNLEQHRWHIVNVDIIVQAEEPRMEPYKGQMKRRIAEILRIDFRDVNVKAKTNEGMGEIGAGHAIAAMAVVMLKRKARRT